MWILGIYLLLTTEVILGEDICNISARYVCPYPDSRNIETAQDLKDNCPKFIKHFNCLGKYDEDCGDKLPRKTFPRSGEFEKIMSILTDICNEGTLLHAAVAQNIKCLKETISNYRGNCNQPKDLVRKSYINQLNITETSDSSVIHKGECLLYFYESGCFTRLVSETCGVMAKNAAYEIIQRSHFHQDTCPLEMVILLSQEVERLDVPSVHKEMLMEAFGRLMQD